MMGMEYPMTAFVGAYHAGSKMHLDKYVVVHVPVTDCQLAVLVVSAYYLTAFGSEQEAYEEKLTAGLLAAAVTEDYGCLYVEDNEQAAGSASIDVLATLRFQNFAVQPLALPDTADQNHYLSPLDQVSAAGSMETCPQTESSLN
ncbi:UNVERIFIED_CONTAM: hypothetical protein Sradi_0710100 [Sesamum radiatum]|uniref:Uncharacterized protein n=1 Tax=Sesamum radiatum TaxID=300843 RepID=A0AAW2VSN8_SESRA